MTENAEKDREVDDLFEVGLQVLLGVSFEDQNLKIYCMDWESQERSQVRQSDGETGRTGQIQTDE